MPCHCAGLPDAVFAEGGVERFVASFELVDECTEHWSRLYRCRSCGQSGKLDIVAPQDREVPIAVKLPHGQQWVAFDDRAFRRALMIREHAGLSSNPRAWADCDHRALKGMSICVLHAYPRLR
jgi:hypothetical protein